MALDYFPCYSSYYKKTKNLSDSELGRLYRALMKYHCTGEREQLNGREGMAFDFMADDIDRAAQAYDEKCRKLKENGKKGQMPPDATNCYQLPPDATNCYQLPPIATNCYQSKDKDKSKSKDKSNGTERVPESGKPPKHTHGEYSNVMLTDEELEKLKSEFPDWEARINRLSGYIASTGRSYKSHYATIREWAKEDKQEQKTAPVQPQYQQKPGNIQPSGNLGQAELEAINRVMHLDFGED